VLDLNLQRLDVQHTPKGSTGPCARRLNTLCKVKVREAEQNETLEAGGVYCTAGPASHSLQTSQFQSYDPVGELAGKHAPHAFRGCHDAVRSREFSFLVEGGHPDWNGRSGAKGMQAIKKESGVTVGQDEPVAGSTACHARALRWE
jgi:two-component system, chemotaxis family, protein-glutamate methylesterase/glutaminase